MWPIELSSKLETLAGQLEAACWLEAAARKPGNVHPEADFADLTFQDFVTSAQVVAPILANSRAVGVGRSIRLAAEATQYHVGKNTNLGILLLLAPLAAVPPEQRLQEGIQDVLNGLTVDDTREVYEAIWLMQPGGMGTAHQQDLGTEPTLSLVSVMQLAAHRDRIAFQYAFGFSEIFSIGVAAIQRWLLAGYDWETVVIANQLEWLAVGPDTLIARKLGAEVATTATNRAQDILAADWPNTVESRIKLQEFDQWLRADGHRRNPGTTADLVAASVFAALRDKTF